MEHKFREIDIKDKVITVIDKNGAILSKCSIKRANKLVKRNCAKWLDEKTIKLLVNQSDRKQLRKEIIEEAGRVCYICGRYIPLDEFPTLDHVIPKKYLGRDEKENLQCCCKRCNDDKADRTISTYLEHIKSNRRVYTWITEERINYLDKFSSKLS